MPLNGSWDKSSDAGKDEIVNSTIDAAFKADQAGTIPAGWNIKNYWWKAMVQIHENIVGIDSAIFMHPDIWKASGHIESFNDPMS